WALPKSGPAYAAALVETLAFLSQARRPVPVAASGAGRLHTLKRRLTMILQKPGSRALSGAGLLAVLALGLLLLPLLPTWAEQQAPPRPADKPAAALPAAGADGAAAPARGAGAAKGAPLVAAGAANALPGRGGAVPPPAPKGTEAAEK